MAQPPNLQRHSWLPPPAIADARRSRRIGRCRRGGRATVRTCRPTGSPVAQSTCWRLGGARRSRAGARIRGGRRGRRPHPGIRGGHPGHLLHRLRAGACHHHRDPRADRHRSAALPPQSGDLDAARLPGLRRERVDGSRPRRRRRTAARHRPDAAMRHPDA